MRRYLQAYLSSHGELAQFFRFATVGAKISAIDIGGVYLLPWLFGINIYYARALSLSAALIAGYLLNRYFTFRRVEKGSFLGQLTGHFGIHLIGGVINYAIFSLIITYGQMWVDNTFWRHWMPLIGLITGGLFGMSFNYVMSKKFVFKTRERTPRDLPFYPEEKAPLPLLLSVWLRAFLLYLSWWFQSLRPAHLKLAPLGIKRLGFLLFVFPLFSLFQGFHWLGLILDEIFFFRYRKAEVKAPFFITGIPRSGTTFVHRTLERHPDFTTMRTWEVLLAPSIVERKLWRGLGVLDRILGSPGMKVIRRMIRRASGNFSEIHGVGPELPEEDYLTLLPAGGCFLGVLAFPFSTELWSLGRLETLARPVDRARWLYFYSLILRKHAWLHPGKQLLIKNAAFASWSRYLQQIFPDARFLFMVREPTQALSSQLSSIEGGLAMFGSSKAMDYVAGCFLAQLEESYRILLEIMETGQSKAALINQADLKERPDVVLSRALTALGIDSDSHWKEILESARRESRGHRSRPHHHLSAYGLSEEEIGSCLARTYEAMLRFRVGKSASLSL